MIRIWRMRTRSSKKAQASNRRVNMKNMITKVECVKEILSRIEIWIRICSTDCTRLKAQTI